MIIGIWPILKIFGRNGWLLQFRDHRELFHLGRAAVLARSMSSSYMSSWTREVAQCNKLALVLSCRRRWGWPFAELYYCHLWSCLGLTDFETCLTSSWPWHFWKGNLRPHLKYWYFLPACPLSVSFKTMIKSKHSVFAALFVVFWPVWLALTSSSTRRCMFSEQLQRIGYFAFLRDCKRFE